MTEGCKCKYCRDGFKPVELDPEEVRAMNQFINQKVSANAEKSAVSFLKKLGYTFVKKEVTEPVPDDIEEVL